MPIEKLRSAEGFPLDARPPRWDPFAVEAANKFFGSRVVTGVLAKYRRAHVTLDYLVSDVMEYDIARVPRLKDDPIYVSALQSVRREFVPQVPLVPLTMGAVQQASTTPKDKSPGLPWIHEGYKTKEDVWNDLDAMTRIRTEWILIGKGYSQILPDCLTYARAQICPKDSNKVRATWGYPCSVFTEEARYVYPYLNFLKNRKDDYPLAYGIEMANGGMGYIDTMFDNSGEGTRAAMLDWKRFDKMVPAWLIRDAFNIFRESFVMDKVVDREGKVWDVNPDISRNRWRKMVNYFINTPFRLPNGDRFRKDGGVPSGSAWTNIIDSIINAIVIRYLFYHCTGAFPEYDMFMGDDSIVMSRRIINIEDMANLARDRFGFILNVDKSYVTTKRENIQFLGYYNVLGFPFRDQDFLIASFILPERVADPDPVVTATRAVGQMYSTFNGAAAQPWSGIISYLERRYSLEPDWFKEYMAKHPNRLKFLRLHGIEATKLPSPKPFTDLCAPMCPPPKPYRRKPVRRNTHVEDLYYQFLDDPLKDEILDPIELSASVVDSIDVLI
nr:RNA-dependent RNA polymerase [Riboviria sp.]